MPASEGRPQELDALVEITEILTGSLPFLEKCESVLSVLADFTGSELVNLRELDVENSTLNLVASYNNLVPAEIFDFPISTESGSIPARALESGTPIVVNDYPSLDPQHQGYLGSGIKSALALPVKVDGEIIGTLGFASGSLAYYHDEIVRVLVGFGAMVGMMISKAELQDGNQVEANIGRIVSAPLVSPDVFEQFAGEVGKIIEFERLALNTVNFAEGTFITEFLFGDDVPNYPIGKALPLEGSALGVVAHSRESQCFTLFNLGDLAPKYRMSEAFVAAGQRYLLDVPLIVGDRVIGTIGINRSSRPFSRKDLIKAERLASLVAGAFADFKQQEYRNRAEREIAKTRAILEAEANIGRILSAPLSGPDASAALKSELANIIPLDRFVILSVDLETETFNQESLGFVNDTDLIVANDSGQTYIGSITGEIIRNGVSQIIHSDDPRLSSGLLPLSQMVFEQGYQSLMAVPLAFEGRIIGTFVCSRREGGYVEEDLVVGERIGTLLAGALATFKITIERDRARLARAESEDRNRAILEAEANIGRILSSPLNGTGASEALMSEIANMIHLDHVVIVAIDTETETFTPDFIAFLNDPRLMVLDNHGKPYAGSITSEVVKHGTGQIIDFDDPRLVAGQVPYAQEMFDIGYRSMMAVPLVFEEKIIGTLILLSRREREYSDEDMANADRIGNLLAGALATFKIATERDRALSDLSESESRFRQIADSIGGVFWLTELNPKRLVYASPKFEDVWGVSLDAVYDDLGLWFESVHPADKPLLQQTGVWASETSESEYEIEYRVIKNDGSVRWIRSRGFPIKDSNGEVFGRSGIAEDVTDQKIELDRINEAGRLLSVGELASGVAHEINNPLAAINLYSESLMGQALPDSVIQDLKVIAAQSQRAATIVRNLLQFARKSSPEITTVNAREFIERCVELKNHDFRINNISASTSIFLKHPEISIDEQLMTQVVVNILSNAEQACAKANRQGHISISVRETSGSTQISISDDGPGIPAENLLKVFDPFFTTKEVGDGTGLGLSVSYGIIAQLGGRLWAESDGVSGSTFHIEVPLESPPTEAGQASEQSQLSGAGGPTGDEAISPLRVLVVDDEPDLRHVLVRLLQRSRHEVEAAKDGEEAWGKLQEQRYDCILLDLRMAGTGGQELFERINAQDPGMATKVIFLTGDLANTDTQSFLSPLTNRVLEKPVSIQDLEEAINSATGSGFN